MGGGPVIFQANKIPNDNKNSVKLKVDSFETLIFAF